ncbi:MAG: basic amino acid/polyamine antiporter [Desulfovibrionales bacterium]|nr:basic amino acid/polyamine antiporter [Desulfovibrionales bacterium]
MERTKKVGVVGLTFLILGAMTGASIFNLPAILASGASTGAIILAWLLTGVGMFCLGMTFRSLSLLRPELTAGIYSYAHEGFGRFAGFEMAWGYWIAGVMSNIGYVVIALDTLEMFFPGARLNLRLPMFILGSVFMWGICALCLMGIRAASVLNIVANVGKYIPLFFFFCIVLFFFSIDAFVLDFWGKESAKFGSVFTQIKSSMLVTLWAFIGIEGAVVLSSKARKKEHVGIATMAGLFISLFLCLSVSILPQGVMRHEEVAGLATPSTAYVLQRLIGNWGAAVINIGVLLAIFGRWIAWTMMVAEVPAAAAEEGVFPKMFAKVNKREAPYVSLLTSGVLMQAGMVVVLVVEDVWAFVLDITGIMVLPVYLSSALFLVKQSLNNKEDAGSRVSNGWRLLLGISTAIFTTWILFATKPEMFWLSSVLWGLGIGIFWQACKEEGGQPFRKGEIACMFCLGVVAVAALVALHFGWLHV